MQNTNTYSPEEAWLARICLVIGVKQLGDFLLSVATLLKACSGLRITSTTLPESMLVYYVISELAVGLYLCMGGGALSLLAHKRTVPLSELFVSHPLPMGTSFIAVAFRGFGAFEIIAGVYSFGRYLMYQFALGVVQLPQRTPLVPIEFAWALEHLIIGGVLLCYGG